MIRLVLTVGSTELLKAANRQIFTISFAPNSSLVLQSDHSMKGGTKGYANKRGKKFCASLSGSHYAFRNM